MTNLIYFSKDSIKNDQGQAKSSGHSKNYTLVEEVFYLDDNKDFLLSLVIVPDEKIEEIFEDFNY